MDSPEYSQYWDEIDLDPQTLREVDRKVEAYTLDASRNSRRASPPPKRIKLSHATNPRPAEHGFTHDFEDLPDITLQGDGLYNVNSRLPAQTSINAKAIVHGSSRNAVTPPMSQKPVSHPARTNGPQQPVAGPSSRVMSRNKSGPVFQRASPSLASASRNADTSRNGHGGQHDSNGVGTYSRRTLEQERVALRPPTTSVSRQAPRQNESPVVRTQHSRTQQNQLKSSSEREVHSLKRMLAIVQAQLQDAEDKMLRKEGEVKVIRDKWQQEQERHDAELAKLKAAKEAAEAAKAQLQREQKEELERIRTSVTFRQMDFDSSFVRRPSMSTKKMVKHVNMTPIRMSDEMRAWGSVRHAGSSRPAETPRRPRFGDMETPSRPQRSFPLSQRPDITAKLPGFVNSFVDSSPARIPSQRPKNKGKEKARDEDIFRAPLSPPASPNRHNRRGEEQPDQTMGNTSPLSSPVHLRDSEPVNDTVPVQDEDVNAISASLASSTLQDEYSDIEPPDWRDTMRRILFTHTLAPSKTPTLQQLLNSPLPSSASAQDKQAYSSASARLLTSVAVPTDLMGWHNQLRDTLRPLSDLAVLLVAYGSIGPLSALFNLLRAASYIIPSFVEALTTPSASEGKDTSQILLALRDAVQRYLTIEGAAPHEATATLAKESVALLEAISWTVPDTFVSRLTAIVRGPFVLPTLLGPKQPAHIVRDTTRALAVLATYPNFFREILARPYPSLEDAVSQESDTRNIKHLDQLYSYIADTSREETLKSAILTLIGSVALAHADAVTTLLQSYILIPSIISYLTEITNPLWEDDEDLMASPTRIDWVLQTTLRIVSLLSYLVFTSPAYNLRYRLHHMPIPRFHGIAHMFTVTMSRLAFADAPTWLNDLQRLKLEETVGMAVRLLDLVIDGPEAEIAWSTFQEDNESKQTETEEERQARLLHPVDIE